MTDVVALKQAVSAAGSTHADVDVLALATVGENYSEHPLAKAIVAHAHGLGIEPGDISDFQSTPGKGVMAVLGSVKIRAGTAEFLESAGVKAGPSILEAEMLQAQGKTAVIISADGEAVGVIGLLDAPRPEAREAITALKALGIEPVMVTGDNIKTAEQIRAPCGHRARPCGRAAVGQGRRGKRAQKVRSSGDGRRRYQRRAGPHRQRTSARQSARAPTLP